MNPQRDCTRDPLLHPAVGQEIAARPASDLLRANEPLIDRLKLCYGADRATFERELLQPIRNYAAFVNTLPATQGNHHAGPGGLFRLGLEAGFFALQGADGHIVSGRATITARRMIEPRWRYAAFLAGLCCEIHRTITHIVVTDEAGNEWPAYLAPLTQWLSDLHRSRFFVRWIVDAGEAPALGLFALTHILSRQTLQYLSQGNSIAMPQMLASIAGTPSWREPNALDSLVKRALALVIDRDLAVAALRFGKPIRGAHLERYLVEAMRRLLATHPAWTPNQERSRVWYARDGLFIVWPNAVAEIRRLLEEDELPGIPGDPEMIAEVLADAGVLERQPDGELCWAICPPESKSAIAAVKVLEPRMLFVVLAEDPVAIAESILRSTPASDASWPQAATEDPAVARQGTAMADGVHTQPATASRQSEFQFAGLASPPEPAVKSMTGSAEHAAEPEPPARARLRLDAPMRLSPPVREALAEIIESLDGDPVCTAACLTAAGAFVPLAELARRQVDPAVALRTLCEAGMVPSTQDGRAQTLRLSFAGRDELGFMLASAFIAGLGSGGAPGPAH